MEVKNKRTHAREYAFKFLYHFQLASFAEAKKEFDKEETQRKMVEFDLSYFAKDKEHPTQEFDHEMRYFSQHLILSSLEHLEELEELLKKSLHRWKIEHLDKVDLTLLTLGACEMKYEVDTPEKVILNEYIEMAKKYGTADSYSFINGVLNQLAKEFQRG